MTNESNRLAFTRALSQLPRFVYGNGLRLAVLSILWVVCSLPIITVGPSTLAVYVAVQDLRSDRNTIDWSRIIAILRQNGVASAVFSGVPVAFTAIATMYGVQALEQGALFGEVVALVSGYIALYVGLVLIPTFDEMASGTMPVTAIRRGVRWVSTHPTAALATALLTTALLALTVLLTVAFVLLFAGVTASLHVLLIKESRNLEIEMSQNAGASPSQL
ncbi:DUF624 domain-containing protein [Halobaculum magnesiiphilum]|uniref:DUF624 domain-containing protein n=1 Tax=Halobaculum magnesiiphilum TaxID=1017351 RepID=A0A8T8WAS8_9EURY|nr:DUF624 domain-containing protein [Halobaculum magnesiiphilum]QZP36936.1 hypothetical protein K6T50_11625 [Halobaculum magnesiiphilum]